MDEFNVQPLIDDINKTLRYTLRRLNLENSRAAKSVKINWSDEGLEIVFNEYVHFIDSGRKPNSKPPPVNAIVRWLNRAGISPKNTTLLQLAFAVSRSIGRKGIKAKPFLDRLHEEVTALVESHILAEIERFVSENF